MFNIVSALSEIPHAFPKILGDVSLGHATGYQTNNVYPDLVSAAQK